jgi:hypothetical protein
VIQHRAMGFNRRKLEDQRREIAEKEAANRRATDAQVLEDAERLIGAWNERKPNECQCCSRRPLVQPLQRAFGFCGCGARLAGPSTRLTFARSTVIQTRR